MLGDEESQGHEEESSERGLAEPRDNEDDDEDSLDQEDEEDEDDDDDDLEDSNELDEEESKLVDDAASDYFKFSELLESNGFDTLNATEGDRIVQ